MARTLISTLTLSLLILAVRAQPVVVYVSHDEEHSRSILEQFERDTGIKIAATFDTEDTKTVGLVKRLISEQASPVCDVFWNNECGQTERLREMGLLQAYRSPVAATIPARFKDPSGFWTGFGARARVLVWNTDMTSVDKLPKTLEELSNPRLRGQLAIAKPLTGTTLTHVTALYTVWGADKTNEWLDALMANEVRWEMGNGPVAQRVADGVVPFGLTDTDDVHSRRVRGAHIETHYLDQGDGALGTLVIPNSVMIMKGAPSLEPAKKLVDYLISAKVEKMLAEGRAAQMPLQPGVETPAHVKSVQELTTMKVDFGAVGKAIGGRTRDLIERFEKVQGGQVVEESSSTMALVWALIALGLAVLFVWLAVKPKRGTG